MKRNLPLAALVLSLSTLSFATTAALAQQATDAPITKHEGKHNPHKTAMKMAKKLNLSQEQTAKLEPILADRRSKMQALKADTTLTDAQRKAQRRTIAQSTRLQMSNVLSADQMKQLKHMRQDRHKG